MLQSSDDGNDSHDNYGMVGNDTLSVTESREVRWNIIYFSKRSWYDCKSLVDIIVIFSNDKKLLSPFRIKLAAAAMYL